MSEPSLKEKEESKLQYSKCLKRYVEFLDEDPFMAEEDVCDDSWIPNPQPSRDATIKYLDRFRSEVKEYGYDSCLLNKEAFELCAITFDVDVKWVRHVWDHQKMYQMEWNAPATPIPNFTTKKPSLFSVRWNRPDGKGMDSSIKKG